MTERKMRMRRVGSTPLVCGSGVRVAEGTALEMRCVGNCTEGSNPSRSDARRSKSSAQHYGSSGASSGRDGAGVEGSNGSDNSGNGPSSLLRAKVATALNSAASR